MFGQNEKAADPVCETLCIVAGALRFEATVASTPVATACTALAARLEDTVKSRQQPATEAHPVSPDLAPGMKIHAELPAASHAKKDKP